MLTSPVTLNVARLPSTQLRCAAVCPALNPTFLHTAKNTQCPLSLPDARGSIGAGGTSLSPCSSQSSALALQPISEPPFLFQCMLQITLHKPRETSLDTVVCRPSHSPCPLLDSTHLISSSCLEGSVTTSHWQHSGGRHCHTSSTLTPSLTKIHSPLPFTRALLPCPSLPTPSLLMTAWPSRGGSRASPPTPSPSARSPSGPPPQSQTQTARQLPAPRPGRAAWRGTGAPATPPP